MNAIRLVVGAIVPLQSRRPGAGCLSWRVLHVFYWNAVRKMRLEPARAREIVEDLAP